LTKAFALASNKRDDNWDTVLMEYTFVYCTILLKNNAPLAEFVTGNYYKVLAQIYQQNGAVDYLIQGLMVSTPTLLSSETSNETALIWLKAWQQLGSAYEELTVPLQVLDAAVRWKASQGDRRVMLSLPEETRSILQDLIQVAEEIDFDERNKL
jgi:hypothetical protein